MASHFQEFLEQHISRIEPLSRDVHIAYWNATISGRREDFALYADLEVEYKKIYSDKESFAKLSAWRDGENPSDGIASRQLDLLYRAYLRNQLDSSLIERITHLSSDIVNKFNVFRAEDAGRRFTSNEVRNVLRSSADSGERKRVWEAEKRVGVEVRDELIELVKLRNEAAQSLGFDNYYTMSLELAEQSEDELFALFDHLEELTREPFATLKTEVDTVLAERCGVTVSELRPWHYHDSFFQEAPRVFELDLDGYYRDRDVVSMVRNFFHGIDLDVDDIIARSDLYEKPGKEQHAYCLDIDRKGDIRVLANVHNDENWTGTMLHELGHAVYDLYIDDELPFLLRQHAHVFATEAIAMFFGRLSKDANWIQQMTGIDDAESETIASGARKAQKLAQLVFARWCQVMTRFERHLYQNPDDDLNAVWWDLVEAQQLVTRPEGRDAADWASKIHIVSAPAYYHNYMLGELLASQLDHDIHKRVLDAGNGQARIVGNSDVGDYLKKNIFAAGKRYRWDEMVERATGEPLNPQYYVDQFVR